MSSFAPNSTSTSNPCLIITTSTFVVSKAIDLQVANLTIERTMDWICAILYSQNKVS